MIDPKDIEEILREPDGSELYRMAAEVRKAYADEQCPDVDVEEEWQRFASVHIRPRQTMKRCLAVASVVLAVCFVAVAAITLPHILSNRQKISNDAVVPQVMTQEKIAEAELNTFVFHNEALGDVLAEIADYYDAEVLWANDSLRHKIIYTQIDKSLSLAEVVQLLSNFDNLSIKLDDDNHIVVDE